MHQLDGGMVFGEKALFDGKRTSTVQAETYCNIYVLDVADFHEVADHFPGIRECVRLIAQHKIDLYIEASNVRSKEKQLERIKTIGRDIKRAASMRFSNRYLPVNALGTVEVNSQESNNNVDIMNNKKGVIVSTSPQSAMLVSTLDLGSNRVMSSTRSLMTTRGGSDNSSKLDIMNYNVDATSGKLSTGSNNGSNEHNIFSPYSRSNSDNTFIKKLSSWSLPSRFTSFGSFSSTTTTNNDMSTSNNMYNVNNGYHDNAVTPRIYRRSLHDRFRSRQAWLMVVRNIECLCHYIGPIHI